MLCAVFIPSAFITGISGQFYRQFALTIAGATIISLHRLADAVAGAVRAAAQAARPAAPRPLVGACRSTASSACSTAASTSFARGYGWLAGKVVRFAAIMLIVYAGVLAFGLNEFRKTPIGFIPQLDRGYHHRGGAAAARRRRSRAPTR